MRASTKGKDIEETSSFCLKVLHIESQNVDVSAHTPSVS